MEQIRPFPPTDLIDQAEEEEAIRLAPAVELKEWVIKNYLTIGGQLHNPDHEHLLSFQPPEISFLWAYTKCEAKDRRVLGQTERVMINVGGWRKDRQELQLIDWFGDVPKYIITLDARVCQVMSDVDFCALVEHELYHIGHKKDRHGEFEYTSMGEPRLFLRGHDVEEFHGVVQRYGASPDVQKMVELANDGPTISRANIAHACGTCLLRLA